MAMVCVLHFESGGWCCFADVSRFFIGVVDCSARHISQQLQMAPTREAPTARPLRYNRDSFGGAYSALWNLARYRKQHQVRSFKTISRSMGVYSTTACCGISMVSHRQVAILTNLLLSQIQSCRSRELFLSASGTYAGFVVPANYRGSLGRTAFLGFE